MYGFQMRVVELHLSTVRRTEKIYLLAKHRSLYYFIFISYYGYTQLWEWRRTAVSSQCIIHLYIICT